MAYASVLLELDDKHPQPLRQFNLALESFDLGAEQAHSALGDLARFGVELEEGRVPVPMFAAAERPQPMLALATFDSPEPSPEVASATTVITARVPEENLEELRRQEGVRVWPNSEMIYHAVQAPEVDLPPFQPPASVAEIQQLLGVQPIWDEGHTGKGVVIGIVDEGVDGSTYPVGGGFVKAGAPAPGSAPATSHGSMCAADALIAAPDALLYDYHFLGVPDSGGALEMFNTVLEHRRADGTPHLTSNSYGYAAAPTREEDPDHEVWDLDHPVHRKIREVVASGAAAFFSAGNCGIESPSSDCGASWVGPGRSITGSNSLPEVITVAAVNKFGNRIGYSSQGPGMFAMRKPDLAGYSHILGNFGPGRPGGVGRMGYDNGTSAATPVAAGVGALLLSAAPTTSPERLKQALVAGVTHGTPGGWDAEIGAGVVNAGGARQAL